MKRSDAFPSRFLSSDELLAHGDKAYRFIIGEVKMEEMIDNDGTTKDVPVCHFQNTPHKVMRLNATNWDTIAEAYGEDSEGWFGQQIYIYVDHKVKFGKKITRGLRIRISPPPQATKPEPKPEPPQTHDPTDFNMDDEIPF